MKSSKYTYCTSIVEYPVIEFRQQAPSNFVNNPVDTVMY